MSSVGQFVNSQDGTRIWADHIGNMTKPSVVFIPGFACTALAFEKQWNDPELLKNLHLVRYDIRGQGQSDQPETQNAYTSARFAEDFRAVCDAFGLQKPFMAGWSMGGYIPVDIVDHYGADFISGVILLGASPWRSMHMEVINQTILSIAPRLLDSNLDVFYKAAAEFVDSCFAYPDRVPAATKYMLIGAVAAQKPGSRTFIMLRTQDETKLVAAKSTIPYLVIQGTLDSHVIADKLVDFMRVNFGNVEVRLLDHCGHAPFYERPIETNEAIVAFVQKVGAQISG